MAKSPKNAAAAATASGLTLAMIVSATQSEQGFMFASKEAAAPFLNDNPPLAEMNEGVVNPGNATEFAVRATAEGINRMNTTTDSNAAPVPTQGSTATGKPSFAIETIDAPTSKPRGGGGVNIYPFDDLPAPAADGKVAAFFVPATDSKPKPWESLQSAVSAATRRYATKTGEKAFTKADGSEGTRATYDYTRKFKLSEGERQGVKGAWVSRTQ
jgi:hypothetical protein